jgi:hypothetical protein
MWSVFVFVVNVEQTEDTEGEEDSAFIFSV